MIHPKIKTKKKTTGGFIALMSAVIISAILILMVTNLSLTSFYNRSNILDFELKERSSALAEACADAAILKLINDSTYSPSDESVNIAGDNCVIESISGGFQRTILVEADYKNYFTNLKIVVNAPDMSLVSWEEI